MGLIEFCIWVSALCIGLVLVDVADRFLRRRVTRKAIARRLAEVAVWRRLGGLGL